LSFRAKGSCKRCPEPFRAEARLSISDQIPTIVSEILRDV
jgi:hypothetical protein